MHRRGRPGRARFGAFGQGGAQQYYQRVLATGPIFFAPLWEPSGTVITDLANGRNGVIGGATPPTFGATGIGDGHTSLSFPGATCFGNIYSAALAAVFNGSEGTVFAWGQLKDADVWTDGVAHYLLRLAAGGPNQVAIYKMTSNGSFQWQYSAGGVNSNHSSGNMHFTTGYFGIGTTWSKSANQVIPYFNGTAAHAPIAGLGDWAGSLAATDTCIGAYNTAAALPWKGQVYGMGVWARALSAAEMASLVPTEYLLTAATMQFVAEGGGQGLTADAANWYWGKDNGVGVNGTIDKLNDQGAIVGTFAGPPHAAGGDWREDHDTILFSSGSLDHAEVWEIDKATGAKIRGWDFTGVDYGSGALVAWGAGDTIYLFTSDGTGAFKIRAVTVSDDGTYVLGDVWARTSLGTPQGLDHKDGFIYYLTDYSGKRAIWKLRLNVGGTTTIVGDWYFSNPSEAEGLTWRGSSLYYGDITRTLYRTSVPA